MKAGVVGQAGEDPVSNVLKWILLAVAIATFGLLGWTTVVTYQTAPPFPDRFVTTGGAVLMSADDIYAGKAGFQKADLMDYGSLYGMGSYFGEDYTAQNLVRLATLTEDNIAKAEHKKNAGRPRTGTAGRRQGDHAGRTARRGFNQTGGRDSRRARGRDHESCKAG